MFKKVIARGNPFCLVIEKEEIAISVSRRKKEVYVTDLSRKDAYGARRERLRVVHTDLANKIEKRFRINLRDYGVYIKR